MRHAIFTIMQNEPLFLPLWYRYYSQHFNPRDMFVLYHPLPDEEPNEIERTAPAVAAFANLIRVYRDESFNHIWLREQVENFAGFLVGSYDTVTFTEADEIIAVDPTKNNDRSLIQWLNHWYCRDQIAARCTPRP